MTNGKIIHMIVLVVVSLLVAYVLFGLLSSTGEYASFGGAAAGFFGCLYFLKRWYDQIISEESKGYVKKIDGLNTELGKLKNDVKEKDRLNTLELDKLEIELKIQRHDCVKSQLESQLGILWTLCKFESNDVRCTIHVPKDDRSYYQITDYYPIKKGANREFPIKKGIVGKSINGRMGFVEKFESVKEYRTKSKDIYNFTDEDLTNLEPLRRSYLCYPIFESSGKLLGVIYFDSSSPNTFKYEESSTSPYNIDYDDKTVKNLVLVIDELKTKLEEYIINI